MAKRKLEHFAEMKTFSFVFEPGSEVMMQDNQPLKGKWNAEVFGNDNPITLELGCGKGEYTIAMARKYPDRNFVGVDIKGARLWRGCRTAHDEGLNNVAFLRIKIEFVQYFFGPSEVDQIWLTFSDPQPKDRRGTKRMNSHYYLAKYARFLTPDGQIHIKTDSPLLYETTLKVIVEGRHRLIEHSNNLYGPDFEKFETEQQSLLAVKTFYEEKFLRKLMPIHYVRFKLNELSN
jgi:tRNA (guanine-N7-)-methyltransferase